MDVMYWTFPHLSGKWSIAHGEKNKLQCGNGRLWVYWKDNTPCYEDSGGHTEQGTRWIEGPAVQEGNAAGAKKFDGDKPMMDLLIDGCPNALLQVGAVLTYGFKKYGGKHGWKQLPDAIKRYEAAMLRHQIAAAAGEVNDPESGLPHAAHIACNALFLAELKKEIKCN